MKKKICMLGAFAAGKTSLVQKYVHTIFSDKYQTTVGVNIEKKQVVLGDKSTDLIIWDLHGEDEFQSVRTSYLRGASGCIYVVDGTRKTTLDVALNLLGRVEAAIGRVPAIFVMNKYDLKEAWDIDSVTYENLKNSGHHAFKSSAKTGRRVEEAFQHLTRLMAG